MTTFSFQWAGDLRRPWRPFEFTVMIVFQVQFVVLILHTLQSLGTKCPFPKWLHYVFLFYCSTFLVLFMHYYRQTYAKQKQVCSYTINHSVQTLRLGIVIDDISYPCWDQNSSVIIKALGYKDGGGFNLLSARQQRYRCSLRFFGCRRFRPSFRPEHIIKNTNEILGNFAARGMWT